MAGPGVRVPLDQVIDCDLDVVIALRVAAPGAEDQIVVDVGLVGILLDPVPGGIRRSRLMEYEWRKMRDLGRRLPRQRARSETCRTQNDESS